MYWLNIPLSLVAIWLVWTLTADENRGKRRNNDRRYVFVASLIFLCGFVLYFIGFNYEGSKHNLVALVGRSLLSSLEMFVSHSDLLEVDPDCKESFLYMAIFSLIHFLAVFVNISLLFNIIGFQSSSFIKIRNWLNSKERRNLYVFVGEGDATQLLSASIRKNDPDAWIVWIQNYEKAEAGGHVSLSSILSRMSYRRSLVDEADEIGAVLLRSHMSVVNTSKTYDLKEVMKDLGLSRLEMLLANTLSANLFFLSDDIEKNMAQTYMFTGIRTVKPIHIFCHACRNEVNLSLETRHLKPDEKGFPPKVTLLDSARMTALKIMETPADSPLAVTEFAEDGSVSKPFTSLVVGFGNHGREAVKLLHEYACFTAPDGSRTRHECTVIDSKMDSIVGPFLTTCPAFRNNPDFRFIQGNAGSTMFWDKVVELAGRLNYAVVATGDDMLNLRIALEIYNEVRKARNNDLHDFIVLTRNYDPSHRQHIDCVVDFYNSTNASSGGRIIPYGRKCDIFDYNLVFNSLVAKGLEVFYKTCLERAGKVADSFDLDQEMNLTLIEKVRRTYSQLVSLCLHIPSNLHIAGIRGENGWFTKEGEEKIKEMLDMIQNGDSKDSRLMYYLAKTEYHRWRAFLDVSGYEPLNDLEVEEYRNYFFAAIEAAFIIAGKACAERVS